MNKSNQTKSFRCVLSCHLGPLCFLIVFVGFSSYHQGSVKRQDSGALLVNDRVLELLAFFFLSHPTPTVGFSQRRRGLEVGKYAPRASAALLSCRGPTAWPSDHLMTALAPYHPARRPRYWWDSMPASTAWPFKCPIIPAPSLAFPYISYLSVPTLSPKPSNLSGRFEMRNRGLWWICPLDFGKRRQCWSISSCEIMIASLTLKVARSYR